MSIDAPTSHQPADTEGNMHRVEVPQADAETDAETETEGNAAK